MPDSTEVRQLLLQINANIELLRSNAAEADKLVAGLHSSMGNHLDEMDDRWEKFGKKLEGLEKPLENIKRVGELAVASLIGENFIEAGKHALEFAGNVQFVTEQVGTSTTFLQQYRYAASQFGVASGAADEGLNKFARSIGQAADGNRSYIETFDRLGVKIRDGNGQVRSVEAVYLDVANAISKLSTPAEKSAAVMTLMGKSAAPLIPLLNQGADGFKTLADAAAEMGIVLSPDLIARSEEMNHKMSSLKQILDAEMASAIAENATQLEHLATSLIHAAAGAAKLAAAHPEAAAGVGAGLLTRLAVGGGPVGLAFSGLVGGATYLREKWSQSTPDELRSQIAKFQEIRDRFPKNSEAYQSYDAGINTARTQLAQIAKPAPKKEEQLGSEGSGATNNSNFLALKDARAQLANLEKAKVGQSGAALAAVNDEVAEQKRYIGFLKTGVPAEQAKSLASKEGAELSKQENASRRAANKAETEREKALQQDLSYRQEELRLRKSILDGAKSSVTNDARRDQLERDIILAEHDTLEAQIADRLAKGGYGKDPEVAKRRADNLRLLNDTNRDQALANVDLQRSVQTQKDQVAAAALQLQGMLALADLDDRLAVTRKDRLRLELRLLELNEQAAKAAQQAIIDSKDPKVTAEDKARAKTVIGQIDAQHGRNVALVEQQNESPLAAYRRQLKSDLDDGLGKVGVDAFEKIGAGTDTAIEKALRLHGIFGSIISDLIEMETKKLILSVIDGATGSGGIFSKLFGGGRATGGGVDPSQFYVVGEEGPEIFAPGMAGNIIPNGALRAPRISSRDLRSNSAGISVSLGGIQLNAPGADPAQLGRLQQAFEQSQSELPARVVQAVVDARSRLVIQ